MHPGRTDVNREVTHSKTPQTEDLITVLQTLSQDPKAKHFHPLSLSSILDNEYNPHTMGLIKLNQDCVK